MLGRPDAHDARIMPVRDLKWIEPELSIRHSDNVGHVLRCRRIGNRIQNRSWVLHRTALRVQELLNDLIHRAGPNLSRPADRGSATSSCSRVRTTKCEERSAFCDGITTLDQVCPSLFAGRGGGRRKANGGRWGPPSK